MAKPSTHNQLWLAATAFVRTLRDANRAQVEDALVGAKQGANDFGLPASERQYYKTLASILGKELKQYGPKGRAASPRRKNPATTKGKKTMARKKRRTAKQRAATKKMIAANRARLRKKTKTARRKTTGRKKARRKTRRNPQKARPGLKKSHLWLVFKCVSGRVSFAALSGKQAIWTSDKGKAVLFRTKTEAGKLAGAISVHVKRRPGAFTGVTDSGTSVASIKRYCASFQELAPGKA